MTENEYKKRPMSASWQPAQPGIPEPSANPANPADSEGTVSEPPLIFQKPAADQAMEDYYKGAQIGRQEFYEDPEMQKLKSLREQYAQGYSGEQLGKYRAEARGQIAGAQQAQQRALQSRLARGGAGGARGAAVMGQQGLQGQKQIAEAERKMALDTAEMERTGAKDLQDFIFKQKAGVAGYGAGIAKIASAERTAKESAAQAGGGGGGCCIIAATVSALSGLNKAEAAELIAMSKGNEAQRGQISMKYDQDPQVLAMINDLNTVRFVRDNHCSTKELRGYYRFSEALAPIVQKSPVLAKIGQVVMVEPVKSVKNDKFSVTKLAGLTWIKVWGFMGSNKPFIRSNGEVV